MPPRKVDVRDYVSRAEGVLRERGEYQMPNDEPGLAYAVFEGLHRMYPHAALSLDKPKFGGEAILRSKDHLGFKKDPA